MEQSRRKEIDVNKPVTNPGLVTAIERYTATFGSLEQQALDAELQRATFLMPVDMSEAKISRPDGSGPTTIHEGSRLKIITYQFPDKPASLMLFTDWEALRAWIKNHVDTIILDAAEAWEFAATQYHGVVINPAGPYLFIDPEHLRRMQRGRISMPRS